MKRALALGVLLTGLAGPLLADGWTMLPFKEPGWSPQFTLSINYGPMDPDIRGVGTDNAIGAQLSLDCPWFSPPTGTIRQQFNFNSFDNDGLKIQTLEMNPHWYVGEGNLRFGVGPGVGYVRGKPEVGDDDSVWGFQLNADIEYRHGALFAGVGTRYQYTEGGKADNLLTQVKLGINF
jgi:hypothetical protein